MLLKNSIKLFNSIQIRNFYKSWSTYFKRRLDTGNYDVVQIGNVSPERLVPDHIVKPQYFYKFAKPTSTCDGYPEIKTEDEIKKMRESCKLAANILTSCQELVKEGLTTDAIDAFVHHKIITNNAYPSPLRYGGFPKSCCTSVNNVACHGIPDDRKLKDGDIINIDITVYLNGFHGDCSRTFFVGEVDKLGRFLVENTEQCLLKSIDFCGPGKPFNLIGKFIHRFTKEKNLVSVPAFIGHGIGQKFHSPPEILHYYNNYPGYMETGMTFTIEPILSLGGKDIQVQSDNWTAMSIDDSRTAQFEHTILITTTGAEILTLPD